MRSSHSSRARGPRTQARRRLIACGAVLALGGLALGAWGYRAQSARAEGHLHLAAARARLEADVAQAPALDRLAASSALSHLSRARELGVFDEGAVALEVRATVLLAVQQGDLPTARQALEAAVAADGWDVETRLLGAEVARRAADHSEARAHLREALARHPEHPRALLGAAALALETGDAVAAQGFAQTLTHVAPDASRAHSLLGEALEAQRDFEGAERAYREALRLNQRDALGHMDLGRVLRVRGELAAAEQAYAQAIALAPRDAAAYLGRGLVRMEQGHGGAALQDLEHARALAPRDAAVWLALGDLRRAAGDLPAALAAYERALEHDPSAVAAEVRVGNTRVAQGDFAGALQAFDGAIARAPAMAEAHNGRGVALMYSARPAEARAAFERAATLAPWDPHPLLNLGILGQRSGQHADAERAFQAALDRDPTSEDALRRLLALRAG